MKMSAERTMHACFVAYVVQAIVNNFAPLLFVHFSGGYGIPLEQITLLVTFNFAVQLLVDVLAPAFAKKIGYRAMAVTAHACAAAGLVLLAVLPGVCPSPFAGLLAAVCVYAMGGGLIEVIISPMMEACPTDNKEKAMSLLHSFYCWGHVGVVLLTTAFFAVFGVENWRVMTVVWALVPAANGLLFTKVPVYSPEDSGERGLSLRELAGMHLFWAFMLMMVCAGASEQAVSQWASAFAEKGLGVSKAVGDLAGPMAFAILMGLSRTIYGKFGDRMNLDGFMMGRCVLCIATYACAALVPHPVAGLVGCAVCGFSVGIFWPGTYSKAAAAIRGGGTVMFAMLALAGDMGCSGGPTLAGLVTGIAGGNMRTGMLAAMVFPVTMLVAAMAMRKRPAKRRSI